MSQPKLFDGSAVGTPQEALDFIGNILESSTEYSVIAEDNDGKVLSWNEGARRIYGYEPEEVVGKACADILYSPEDVAAGKPKRLLAASVRDGKWEGTIERVRKSGERFRARMAITLRRDPGGQPIGFLLISKDISREIKLTKAEDALRQSEEKYRLLIAHIPEVTWTADARGNVTFISANVQAMYGFTADEVLANGEALWVNRVHPEDRDRVLAAYADLFAGRQVFDAEYRLQRKDGGWIWGHGWSVSTYERDGVLYADGMLHDITARKSAEEQFRNVARDRELLLESTADGIYAVDNKGRCTMANRVTGMLLGRTIDELIGKPIHELIHHHKADGSPYPREECVICRALRAGKTSRVAHEVFWRKDGTSFPVEYVSSPLMDDGVVRGAVVTFSDVTERRKFERRLEQAGRISSLGRMAATIAHEFNNVLMGIQPFAELVRRRAGDDAKLQQAAGQILNSVTRGKNITQDILRMARSPEPALQSIDVTGWLQELAKEIRAQVGPHIVVTVEAPAPGTLCVRCDPAQMQQVVMNLALNARDAMSSDGTLTLAANRADGVRLVVADTGSGISPEILPFIFEPLFTTKQSGTGMGLAVAQQLVVRNGGTIAVESTPGVGTRFQIELPEAMPVVPNLLEEPLASPEQFGVRRVVIVEDDQAVARGLSSILESENVEVRVVSLGSEAVNAVAAFEPDVVMIDMGLPDMSGSAVYERIAAKWPRQSVIFSSGHADESQLPHPRLQHIGFLRKPYSTETLLNKLREVV